MPIFDCATAHLSSHPYDAYVWQTLLEDATPSGIAALAELASRLLPLDQVRNGPADDLGLGLIRTALANRVVR